MKLFSSEQPSNLPPLAALQLGTRTGDVYVRVRHEPDAGLVFKRNGIVVGADNPVIPARTDDPVAREIERTCLATGYMPLIYHDGIILGCIHENRPGHLDYRYEVFARFDGNSVLPEGAGIASARKGRRVAATKRRNAGRTRAAATLFGEPWPEMDAERRAAWERCITELTYNVGVHGMRDRLRIAIFVARMLEESMVSSCDDGTESFLRLSNEKQWHWYQFAKQVARILPAPRSYRQGQVA